MAQEKDYLGDKLRLVERAREDIYFRKLDQELIDKMRQQAAQEVKAAEDASPREGVFSPILVPVDFSVYAMQALDKAADLAGRFGASIIALHVIASEIGVQTLAQRLGIQTAVPSVGAEMADTPDVSDEEVETVIDQHREEAYQALQAFLPPRLAQYPLELRVVFGRPFERIVEIAVKEKVALIVNGDAWSHRTCPLGPWQRGRTGRPPRSVFGFDREGPHIRIEQLVKGLLHHVPRSRRLRDTRDVRQATRSDQIDLYRQNGLTITEHVLSSGGPYMAVVGLPYF
jgi:nucleotide-binding universal stress UspA family protein